MHNLNRSQAESPDAEDPVASALVFDEGVVAAFGGAVPAVPVRGYRPRTLGPLFWVSMAWLVLVVLLATLYQVLPIEDPSRTGIAAPRIRPFEGGPLLGTDNLGRDMLARVIAGARVSLAVGVMSISLGLAVGGFLGVVSGYFRGRIETVIMGLVDALLAFPALVLGLAMITFVAQNNASIWHVTFTIGLLSVPSIARIIRASTLSFSQREFVMAARTLGAKDWWIIRREILPNVLPPVLSFSLIAVAVAIVAEGGLAFLGLSVRPPTPTWGGMINEGRQVLRGSAHVSLIPSGAMFLTVLALNYAGDALQSRFEFREGGA